MKPSPPGKNTTPISKCYTRSQGISELAQGWNPKCEYIIFIIITYCLRGCTTGILVQGSNPGTSEATPEGHCNSHEGAVREAVRLHVILVEYEPMG
jgi:hypothetical protein